MKSVDDIQIEERNGRFYAKTDDKFDGSANGYGYKTKQALIKARWYYLNKATIDADKERARAWLNENKEAKSMLNSWLDDTDYWFYDCKDGGDGPSLKRFLAEHEEESGQSQWFKTLSEDKEFGKIVWRWVLDGK
jgi:hypothetical protein